MRVWKVLALGLLAAACGDEKSEGGGGDTSSIDGKKISQLSGTELKSLCEWLAAQEKKSTITDEQFCTQDAVDWSETKDECEEYRDDCLVEQAEQGDLECEDFNTSKDCGASVKEFKACVSELNKLYDAAAKKASCDKLDATSLSELPDSCADLPEDCIEVDVSVGALMRR